MNNQIIIWGASGHARVVADIWRLNGGRVAGFLDDVNRDKHGTTFCDSKILGGREILKESRQNGVEQICIGIGSGKARLRLSTTAEEAGFRLVSVIHPKAIVASDVKIGAGTVIASGAVINPNVTIGRNVIINTGATVDHDSVIEEGAHIGPGAHLAASINIGRLSWVGIGATVIERIFIGANALVGAGAVVVRNIPESVVAYGNPARIAGQRKENDPWT
jgi:acetyltransferase EpsM